MLHKSLITSRKTETHEFYILLLCKISYFFFTGGVKNFIFARDTMSFTTHLLFTHLSGKTFFLSFRYAKKERRIVLLHISELPRNEILRLLCHTILKCARINGKYKLEKDRDERERDHRIFTVLLTR